LQTEGWDVIVATSGEQALAALHANDLDVIVTDLVMEGVDGMAILREAKRCDSAPRVILMTAFASLETAIEAMRVGAYDYLTKPFKLAQLSVALRRALDDRRLRAENRRLREEVERQTGLDNMIGRSKAMKTLFEHMVAVAGSEATVLLLGESGTGKELVARAIHQRSRRGDGPFIAVNCAAIPDQLLESELFGHEKGAFTGADRRHRGLFAEADGGTLFLDEVGDLPPPLQGKLLRALQDRAIRPVGGAQDVQLDLRVISATHRDLPELVKNGRFRRLAGKILDGFDDEATAWLLEHRWPGNVRELENVVERAAILARGPKVTRVDLGVEFVADAPAGTARPTLLELEYQYMQRVLAETKGDKRAAARILGVSVRTLQRKLK